MIHNARQTSKFITLVRRLRSFLLEIPIEHETVAVGILERLWHFTIINSPRGDIGRHDNAVIAEACGWYGDADDLVSLLTDTGWLDSDSTHRLLVHDWDEHAPRHIKQNIERKGGFVRRNVATSGGNESAPDINETLGLDLASQNSRYVATPNLTKPNVTKPNLTKCAADAATSLPVTNETYSRAEEVPVPPTIDAPAFIAARDQWLAMRRRHRWSCRPEYLIGQYARLAELPLAQAVSCLEHSTANEYQGLFPEKFKVPNAGQQFKQRNGPGQLFDPTTVSE